MDVNQRIKQLMEERGWSMYMLSKKSGLSNTTIQAMFARNTLPSIPTLEAICHALGITVAQFFSAGDTVVLDKKQKDYLESFSMLSTEQQDAILKIIHLLQRS